MKLIFGLTVFAIASIYPTDAFGNSIHQSSSVVSLYKSREVSSTCQKSKQKNVDSSTEERQADETIPDSSRRLAMLRLTAMVSSAFLIPNRANADDEFEIFSEESDEIDEFLDDYEEENASSSVPSALSVTPPTRSSASTADPWDKFEPKLTPNDGSGSAFVQADIVKNSSSSVSPVPRQVAKTKSITPVTSSSKTTTNKQELDTDHMDPGSFFALSFPVMVLGAAAYTFQKQRIIIENASESHYSYGNTKR